MAIYSSILAWRIPCTEDYSPKSCKEPKRTEQLSTCLGGRAKFCEACSLNNLGGASLENNSKLQNKVDGSSQGLLLLLSHLSRVRLCATPETAAHQAPPSLGFSRQEHWNGLPFPSPMHESEK